MFFKPCYSVNYVVSFFVLFATLPDQAARLQSTGACKCILRRLVIKHPCKPPCIIFMLHCSFWTFSLKRCFAQYTYRTHILSALSDVQSASDTYFMMKCVVLHDHSSG